MNKGKKMWVAGLLAAAMLGGTAQAQDKAWLDKVGSLIRANFSYPRSAEVRKEQGRAILQVALASDGKIADVQVAQSSGSAILDREALRIANKIGKFPTPPKGMSSVKIPIIWRLD